MNLLSIIMFSERHYKTIPRVLHGLWAGCLRRRSVGGYDQSAAGRCKTRLLVR